MIKILVTILLALPLLSIAPIPAIQPPMGKQMHADSEHFRTSSASIAPVSAVSAIQPCTWETAPARLRQEIEDPIGYPFGHVEAWSCAGDTQAVIAELAQRVATMQAQAVAYRQAHPIAP